MPEGASKRVRNGGAAAKRDAAGGAVNGGAAAAVAARRVGDKPLDSDATHVADEFGGPPGAAAVMLFSHFIPYYLWLCVRFHRGALVLPSAADVHLLRRHAAPSARGVALYGAFQLFQLLLALVAPGVRVKGLPVPSEGNRQLTYTCNGLASWYVTLVALAWLQMWRRGALGAAVMEHFGELLTASVLVADAISVAAYVSARAMNATHRMSGNVVYDFFMGAWLNPHIGGFDFKLWGETRVAWTTLFTLTLSAAIQQLHELGYVTASMCFIVAAQGIYTNAVMKGEQCIPTTWDIFYEKWGWMLIYWNFAGVPFVYCIQAQYLYYNGPVKLPPLAIASLFVTMLLAYYVWDTCMSQRAAFRMQLAGTDFERNAFPRLPWGRLRAPRYLDTTCGSKLLVDGWWRYARKVHYTADLVMASTWALCCGFGSLVPYFYPAFFLAMIVHRHRRDVERCRRKYGSDWERYEKVVPYSFIPGVI